MILLKKALRSIWRGKRAFAACIFLIALGIASYVGFAGAGAHLLDALDSFYREQRFGEVFASVAEIPAGAAQSLGRVEGVAGVSYRTAVTARYLDGGEQQPSLRVISWDPDAASGLNQPLLLEGRMPGRNEIVVSKNFFYAQGLAIGDTIAVTANGRQLRPVVTGVAVSPEYIVEVGEGMTGDGASAGYAYMLPAETATLADSGYYNELSFLLDPGTAFADVEAALEEALNPYGLVRLYGREDHEGHWETYTSIASLSSTAVMISFVFLGVAVLVLTILLRRVIEQERMQIGTLKAFGLSAGTMLRLYLLYGVLISLAGCVMGCAGGIGIAYWAAGLYYTMFFMPAVPMTVPLSLLVVSAAVALSAGAGGAAMGARSVLKLSPAESMRPPAPPVMKRKKAHSKSVPLPAPAALALRGIARGRGRSAFVAGGMALSFAILAFMASYASMMDAVMLAEFDHAQRYDMKLSLTEPRPCGAAVQSALALPEVEGAEGILELPATFHKAHLQEDGSLTGLTMGGEMRRLYDSRLELDLDVPPQGVVLGRSLAEKLEAGVGDTVQFTTGYTGDERFTVTVAALLAENSGSAAYLNLPYLCNLLGSGETVNGLLLRTASPSAVTEALSQAENVDAMVDQAVQRRVVQNILDQTLGVNLGLFLVIGFGVAFAIVIATASIALSERSREYATMRVLGMEPRQIGMTLILEYLMLAAVGFLPGVPLAIGLKTLLVSTMSDESLYLSTGISPVCFLAGAAICLGTVGIANLSSIRRIARLDMTEVLKERE